MKNILILIIFFYILVLLQTSFLIHWQRGQILNLILISVVLINFFEKSKNYSGLLSAFIGGFFWDIFSAGPIGLHVLILLGLAIFIKKILKRYIRFPSIKGILWTNILGIKK